MDPSTSLHCESRISEVAPHWLRGLLAASFFSPCPAHAVQHRADRNFFCISCGGAGGEGGGGSLCSVCVRRDHTGPTHAVLQIRKSSYHDAVRISDVGKLLDLSGIQVYVINGAKIVFLNGRPQAKPIKGAPYHCETCQRTLLDACCFCAISCKLQALPLDPSLSLSPSPGRPSPSLTVREWELSGPTDSPAPAMLANESAGSTWNSNSEESRFSRGREKERRDRATLQCGPNAPPSLPSFLPEELDDASTGDILDFYTCPLYEDGKSRPGAPLVFLHTSDGGKDTPREFGIVKRLRGLYDTAHSSPSSLDVLSPRRQPAGLYGEEAFSACPPLEDEVAPASPLLAPHSSTLTWRLHKRKGVPQRSPLA